MPGSVSHADHVRFVIIMSYYFADIFGYDSSFRIALMIPNDKLNIACTRISEFCNKHYKK